MRIAIYGAGSLGIVLGAYLSRAGIQADLVNRNEAQVTALRKNGARVEGEAPFSAPVRALPYVTDDLDATMAEFDRLAARDGVAVHLPTLWQHADPWA